MANSTNPSGAKKYKEVFENDTNVFIILIPTFVITLVIILTLGILNIILIAVSASTAIILSCFLFLIDKYDKNIKRNQIKLIKAIDLKLEEIKTKLNTAKNKEKIDGINEQMRLYEFELMLKTENLLCFKRSIKYLASFTISFIALTLSLYFLFSYIFSYTVSTNTLNFPYFSFIFFVAFALLIITTCLAFYMWFYFSELSTMDTIIEEYRVNGLDLTILVHRYLKKIPFDILLID